MSIVTTIDSQAQRNRPVSVVTVTPADTPVVSLEQVRRFVSQSLTDDDDVLQMLIESATDTVSGILGFPIVTTVRQASFDVVTPRLYLTEPATNVASVTVTNVDGDTTTVNASAYVVDTVSRPARVTQRPDYTWTDLVPCDVASIAVRYTTGWTPSAVPPAVIHAVVVHIAQHYEDRQATGSRTQYDAGIRALLRPHVLQRGIA